MIVETEPHSPLKLSRPEGVHMDTISEEIRESFERRGLTDPKDQIAAEMVVMDVVDNELHKEANPYALYLLKGKITSIIVDAIADFRKETLDQKANNPL